MCTNLSKERRTSVLPPFPPKDRSASSWGKAPYPGLPARLHHQEVRHSVVESFRFLKGNLCCFAYANPSLIPVIVATLFSSSFSKYSGGCRKNLTDLCWVYHTVYLICSWYVSILSHRSIYVFPHILISTVLTHSTTQLAATKAASSTVSLKCPLLARVNIAHRNAYVKFGCYPQTMYIEGWI